MICLSFVGLSQTCNKLNHNCSNTVSLNTSGVTSNGGSTYACSLGNNVLYSSSGSDPWIATDDIVIGQGMASTLHFDARRASGYFGTGEVWAHVGGYCTFSVYDVPFNDNGWVEIGTFNPNTTCSQFGPFTIPSDVAGGNMISYCIVLKGASSTNFVSIDDICVSEISGSGVPTTMDEDFGSSSSGWYPNAGVDDIPYHTYKNASDAYTILGTGADGFPDKAAYFYTGFDFCSSVSGVGLITKEVNTSGYTNGEIRVEFKSKYPCSGANGYTFDENYTFYSPEIFVMTGPDNGSNSWTQLPVNYYFADYNWRVASYDISAYKNANVKFKIERGGFCGTSMEAVDNIKILDRDCSISLESCGTITGQAAPLQNTDYPYSVPAVTGATYYKWYVRHDGNLYDTAPYIVSGQGTQTPTINFQSLPSSGVRVLCIPYDADPSTNPDACYAQIGLLNVTVSASNPLIFSSVDSTHVTCNGLDDGTITLGVSGGQPTYSYAWVPNVSTTNSASGLAPGPYQITVTDQNLDQIVENIVITEPSAMNITMPVDFSICAGDTSNLNSTVTGGTPPYSYSWTPATNISNATIPNPNVYPNSSETYVLTVTDANSCTDNDNVNVNVNPLPVVDIATSPPIGCTSHSVSFVPIPGGGVSCFWDFGDSNTSTDCVGPTNVYSTAGSFDVTYSETDGNGCTGSVTYVDMITVHQTPTVDAGLDEILCDGDSLTLTALNPDAGTLSWSNGVVDGVQFLPTIGGYYTVQSLSVEGCTGFDSLLVTINPVPSVDLGADITSCDAFVTLDAGAGMDNYLWSNTQTTQTIDATSSGNYWVTVTQNGCDNSDTIDVVLLDCTNILEFGNIEVSIYPNPAHDIIYVTGAPQNSEIQLFDMNGKVCFSKTNILVKGGIDISSLERGTYLMKIFIEGEGKVLQFIKE